jgi:hypothetical protein
VDWSAAERDLGIRLPKDYQHLVDTYGLGCFDDFLWLLHPAALSPHLNLGRQIAIRRKALEEGQLPGEQPTPDEVIPWAYTDNGDVCYWKVIPVSDPNKWTILVNESRGPRWEEFEGSTTDWLAAVLSGRHRIRSFPSDFPSDHPHFRPMADAVAAHDQPGAGTSGQSDDSYAR